MKWVFRSFLRKAQLTITIYKRNNRLKMPNSVVFVEIGRVKLWNYDQLQSSLIDCDSEPRMQGTDYSGLHSLDRTPPPPPSPALPCSVSNNREKRTNDKSRRLHTSLKRWNRDKGGWGGEFFSRNYINNWFINQRHEFMKQTFLQKSPNLTICTSLKGTSHLCSYCRDRLTDLSIPQRMQFLQKCYRFAIYEL